VILDSSALVAIVMAEPGADALLHKIRNATVRGIGAPTLLEASIVLAARLRGDPSVLLFELLRELDVEIVSFTREHSEIALSAFLNFGKGRHHAALNFGDCLAYAAASAAKEALLFVGADFSKTDIIAA